MLVLKVAKMEVTMDGIVFLVFWIAGATIHTIVELRCKAAGVKRPRATASDAGDRHCEGDGY